MSRVTETKMLRFASSARPPPSSSSVLHPSAFMFSSQSSQVTTPSKPFLSSSSQSHSGTLSLCCRRLSIPSKSSQPPPPDTEAGEEHEFKRDFFFEVFAGDKGFEIEVQRVVGKKNRRRIRSKIRVDADLDAVWKVLTNYEGLSSFIPSLVVCQLLEKGDKFARLYQVGEQNLALGLKFNAKGVLECFEGDLEHLPFGRRRDIKFRMVDGDFQTFEGRWSIEQIDNERLKDVEHLTVQEYRTALSYVVEIEPKLWVPVHLLEGRVCKEVKNNLQSVRDEAQRIRLFQSETLTQQ